MPSDEQILKDWRGKLVYRKTRLAMARWRLRLKQTAANVLNVKHWRDKVAQAERVLARHSARPKISAARGATGIVADAFAVAYAAGGPSVWVASAYRRDSTTSSGNRSDHSQDNETQAARDIAKQGVDAIHGPPSHELDLACVAIGKAFGRSYPQGKRVVDTFHWKGYRIQIIWRTPEYGGHMGHVHVGARRD